MPPTKKDRTQYDSIDRVDNPRRCHANAQNRLACALDQFINQFRQSVDGLRVSSCPDWDGFAKDELSVKIEQCSAKFMDRQAQRNDLVLICRHLQKNRSTSTFCRLCVTHVLPIGLRYLAHKVVCNQLSHQFRYSHRRQMRRARHISAADHPMIEDSAKD